MRHPWNPIDYFQTLCSFLHSGVVDVDAKDSRGLTLHDLLQEDENLSLDSQASDMLHCVVEREARCNPQLQNWVLEHPRKPSVYDTAYYMPFHHRWCLTNLNHDEPIEGYKIRWDYQQDGFWPDMTPEEEHTVAHGCYVRKDSNTRADYSGAWYRWSSSGETFVCDLEGDPDEAIERQPISFPCTDCISRWLHDTGSSRPQDSNDRLHSHHSVRFVATSTGGIWDFDNTIEDYPVYAWVPAPTPSSYRVYSFEGSVEKEIKTVHVPRLSEVLDSDIDIQRDHKQPPENPTRRRARTTSSSGDEDRVYKRPRLND